VSTGEFRLGNAAATELTGLIARFAPKEILVRGLHADHFRSLLSANSRLGSVLISSLPEVMLRSGPAQIEILNSTFRIKDLSGLPCGKVTGGAALAAALLQHFTSLHMNTQRFRTLMPLVDTGVMQLDETVIRDLELFSTVVRNERSGSLAHTIDRTKTAGGARLLRHFLVNPLTDVVAIAARHNAVEWLTGAGSEGIHELRDVLKGSGDLRRLATRVSAGSASPGELGVIRRTLVNASSVSQLFAKWSADCSRQDSRKTPVPDLLKLAVTQLNAIGPCLKLLNEALIDAPGSLGTGNQVFRTGFNAELDSKLAVAANGQGELDNYEAALRQRTGISSLKIKSHQSFGVLIEVTKANLSRVPADFIRRQTMVNCERFVTVELNELGEALSSASDGAKQIEATLFGDLLQQISTSVHLLSDAADSLAFIDVMQSFAQIAVEERWVRPHLKPDGDLQLRLARHPVVESFTGRHQFVPNDIHLTRSKTCVLITGPNMGGKSTAMRQTALAALLAQVGAFVPAAEASLPVFDRIFTRVGAADDLSRGQSTFMVEMTEAAAILRQATHRSLVILDEVGRGTSTRDGLAIATAIFRELVTRIRCFAMFATHYHELVPVAESLSAVSLVQTEVHNPASGAVQFTHRLIPGASGSSFGIEVAELAGVPIEVIRAAREALASPLAKGPESLSFDSQTAQKPLMPAMVESDPRSQTVLAILERVRINRTTPLQALNILNEMLEQLDRPTTAPLFHSEHPQ